MAQPRGDKQKKLKNQDINGKSVIGISKCPLYRQCDEGTIHKWFDERCWPSLCSFEKENKKIKTRARPRQKQTEKN